MFWHTEGSKPLPRTVPLSVLGRRLRIGATSYEGAEGCSLSFKPSFQDGQWEEGIIGPSFLPAQEASQFLKVLFLPFDVGCSPYKQTKGENFVLEPTGQAVVLGAAW